MAFQPLPDGVKAVIEWGTTNIKWTNTMYFTRPGFTQADQEIFVDLVHDQFENLADVYLASAYNLNTVTVYDMRSEIAPVAFSGRAPYVGGISGNPGAVNIGLVVTHYTSQRGKSGRGRNYLAGFSEDDMDALIISDTILIGNINTFYLNIIPNWVLNGWTHVIASGQQGGVELAELQAYPVTSSVVRNQYYGTQRRRIPRP